MKQRHLSACVSVLLLASAVGAAAPAAQEPAPPKPLATRTLDVEGVVAEVIESVRKDGVLTVRVRFRNIGSAPAKISLAGGGTSYHTANYISAGDTKYEILRDTGGNVMATPRDGGGWLQPTIKPKGTWGWWAKYQAPPADKKTYTLYLKVGPPIEDVPIIDQ
jgi:hypothetical protein